MAQASGMSSTAPAAPKYLRTVRAVLKGGFSRRCHRANMLTRWAAVPRHMTSRELRLEFFEAENSRFFRGFILSRRRRDPRLAGPGRRRP